MSPVASTARFRLIEGTNLVLNHVCRRKRQKPCSQERQTQTFPRRFSHRRHYPANYARTPTTSSELCLFVARGPSTSGTHGDHSCHQPRPSPIRQRTSSKARLRLSILAVVVLKTLACAVDRRCGAFATVFCCAINSSIDRSAIFVACASAFVPT